MQTAHGNLHLEIQTTRKSPVGIVRTSFRENGKMMAICAQPLKKVKVSVH
jgi:hypothetical protein